MPIKRSRPKSQRQYVRDASAIRIARALPGAKAGTMPAFIAPCLATLADRIPAGERWQHEIKFDGYRLQLRRDGVDIRFLTRRGHNWTERFSNLMTPAWNLPCERCVIDGEVVIIDRATGLSDFGALQTAIRAGSAAGFTFYAFDVLFLDGLDLRGCALADRRITLETLLVGGSDPIRLSEVLDGGGDRLFREACKLGLEGIVSKRKDGRYRSARSNVWTKVTCRKRDTFVVAGIAFKGDKFDGIYLGRRKGRALTYAGKVENGFAAKDRQTLKALAERLRVPRQALKPPVKKPKAVWLKPKLLAEVEYRALTGDGKLRHPSFKSLREDV